MIRLLIRNMLREAQGWWEDGEYVPPFKVGDTITVSGTDEITRYQTTFTVWVKKKIIQQPGGWEYSWDVVTTDHVSGEQIEFILCHAEEAEIGDDYRGPYFLFTNLTVSPVILDAEVSVVHSEDSVNEAKGWWTDNDDLPPEIRVWSDIKITGTSLQHGMRISLSMNVRKITETNGFESLHCVSRFDGSYEIFRSTGTDLYTVREWAGGCPMIIMTDGDLTVQHSNERFSEAKGWWEDHDEELPPEMQEGTHIKVTGISYISGNIIFQYMTVLTQSFSGEFETISARSNSGSLYELFRPTFIEFYTVRNWDADGKAHLTMKNAEITVV